MRFEMENREEFSKEKHNILCKELEKIYNNADFVEGTLDYLHSDFDIDIVLRYIEKGIDVTPSYVLLIAMSIEDSTPEEKQELLDAINET